MIKPVLKRESEESEQPATLLNSEGYLRSILKSNLNLRPVQTTNDAATSKSEEDGLSGIESENQSSETKVCERVDSSDVTNMTQHSLQCLCDDMRTTVSKKNDNKIAVPSHKTTTIQNEKILWNNMNNCKIDISSSRMSKKRNDKWRNNLLIDKSNELSDVDNDNGKDDNNDNQDNEKSADNEKQGRTMAEQNDDDHASSSSNDHEVHRIIGIFYNIIQNKER